MKAWKTKTVDGQRGVVLRDIDREDHEFPSSAYGAEVEHDEDGNPNKVTFPEVRFLPFADAGKRLPVKKLFTVVAEKPNGVVTQLPLEDQINNNTAAPDMYIGLQFYTRKGFNVFFDFETGEGAFCPTWDCWAEWDKKFNGYCSDLHKETTEQNDDGTFSGGVTTSRTWG